MAGIADSDRHGRSDPSRFLNRPPGRVCSPQPADSQAVLNLESFEPDLIGDEMGFWPQVSPILVGAILALSPLDQQPDPKWLSCPLTRGGD